MKNAGIIRRFAFIILAISCLGIILSSSIEYTLRSSITQKQNELKELQNNYDELIMIKNETFSYEKVRLENPELNINQNIIKINIPKAD